MPVNDVTAIYYSGYNVRSDATIALSKYDLPQPALPVKKQF